MTTAQPLAVASLLFATWWCARAADARVTGRLVDPQGKPVADAKLQLLSASTTLQAATDASGRFLFPAAPPGDYELRAVAPGFSELKRPLHLGETEAAAIDLGLSLQAPASAIALTGIVVDPSQAAISGAAIRLQKADGTVRKVTRSDTNGSFVFSGLSPGDYQIAVSHPAFESKEFALTVGAGAPPPVRITLVVRAVSTTVTVQGREDDLVGIAASATQGTVGAREIQNRPIFRSGEVLETVPGLIITQHAGGGKANQYFLRGFNLDHGTDFAVFLDDMPLNLPSHAHGEGYSDMNTVIPEFVRRVNFEKGPYYADIGNYGSAGSARLEFVKTLPQNFFQVEGGMYGYERAVFGVSQNIASGNLLYGAELYHDDGPWKHPDDYKKFNGILTYSQGSDENGFSVTARAYHGKWTSSDQIADNAVPLVGLFGTLNPTDGGRSQRYSLQGEWHRLRAKSKTKIALYGFYYDLDLFSDFTYYLTDPIHGDQFEQKDRRWVIGLDARHTIFSQWFGHSVENTFGLQVRNDWVHNGLFQTQNRIRTDKVDSETGTILPATTQEDRFTDTQIGFYAENKIQWAEKFRTVAALRSDVGHVAVTSLVTPANSGTAAKVLPSPKLSLIAGPWSKTEFYLQGGFSFHSNDARGASQTVQPVSNENPYPNTPASRIPLLIPTKGAEIGVRTSILPHLQSTLSLWYLRSASELQQSGDTGGTVASTQPSNRYGIESANYYTPLEHLAFDFDLADSRAFFTTVDSDDAAPDSPGGKRVPEAVRLVVSSGVTVHDSKRFSGSLRLRAFGPRDLTSDGISRSRATILLNASAGYRINRNWRFVVEILNLLNRKDHDIDYAYESRITPTSDSAFTNVFHPVEPLQVRFGLQRIF
jgi:hypothetical protein